MNKYFIFFLCFEESIVVKQNTQINHQCVCKMETQNKKKLKINIFVKEKI